jgi:hypothetical protein
MRLSCLLADLLRIRLGLYLVRLSKRIAMVAEWLIG